MVAAQLPISFVGLLRSVFVRPTNRQDQPLGRVTPILGGIHFIVGASFPSQLDGQRRIGASSCPGYWAGPTYHLVSQVDYDRGLHRATTTSILSMTEFRVTSLQLIHESLRRSCSLPSSATAWPDRLRAVLDRVCTGCIALRLVKHTELTPSMTQKGSLIHTFS